MIHQISLEELSDWTIVREMTGTTENTGKQLLFFVSPAQPFEGTNPLFKVYKDTNGHSLEKSTLVLSTNVLTQAIEAYNNI